MNAKCIISQEYYLILYANYIKKYQLYNKYVKDPPLGS